MGKTKTLTEKQKQRRGLNAVLDYNERQLVKMQGQGWKDLTDEQINLMENFIATAIETMRICPPAYVGVASNTVSVRAKSTEIVNLVTDPNGTVNREEKPEGTAPPVVEDVKS